MSQLAPKTSRQELTSEPHSRVLDAARSALPALAVVIVVGLFAQPFRALWLDELFHFATGGMTFREVVKTIDYTTIEVGHGQTGVYILLDWFLMQVFGAQAWALRLPSLISAIGMLWAAIVFMRGRGFGPGWQAFAVVSLGAHSFLMFFTAEARPYMPIACASIAMLAFYGLGSAQRRQATGYVLGFLGFIWGSAMHPYWIVFAIGAALVSLTWQWHRGLAWRRVVMLLAPGWLALGSVLWLGIGQLTWMRRSINFGFDPLYHLKTWTNVVERFLATHLIADLIPWWLTTSVVLLLGLVVVAFLRGAARRAFIGPTAMIAFGVATTVLLTALSVSRGYWVVERQWVAGMAIVSLGVTWALALALRSTATPVRVVAAITIGLTLIGFVLVAVQQVRGLVEGSAGLEPFRTDPRSVAELAIGLEGGEDSVIAMNINAARGGPVWPQFINWYNREAGMRPEFRDIHWSWTTWLWGEPNVPAQPNEIAERVPHSS